MSDKIKASEVVGFHANMSFQQYIKIDAINQSALKKINKSPFKFWWYLNYGQEKKDHFVAGRLGHKCILEPTRFDNEHFKMPKEVDEFKNLECWNLLTDKEKKSIEKAKAPTMTKAYKKLKKIISENTDKDPINEKEWKKLMGLKNAMQRSNKMKDIANDYMTEVVVVWYDNRYECYCKGMLDGINAKGVIADLKTTKDAGLPWFVYDAKKYGYDFQLAYYLDGAIKAFKQNPGSLKQALKNFGASKQQIDNFSFRLCIVLAVEKSVPQELGIYRCKTNGSVITSGRDGVERAFKKYKECKDNNKWPMYRDDDGSEIIDLDYHYKNM